MQRLKDRKKKSRAYHVLANQEQEVLLLLDNRHVKHEKDNLAYLTGILDKTNKSFLNERDVVSHVFEKYSFLYSEDIESIQEFDNYFTVSVYPNTLIHFGQFNIYKG